MSFLFNFIFFIANIIKLNCNFSNTITFVITKFTTMKTMIQKTMAATLGEMVLNTSIYLSNAQNNTNEPTTKEKILVLD